MNWKERAANFSTRNVPHPLPSKLPKVNTMLPLEGLGGMPPPPFRVSKNNLAETRHAYRFILTDGCRGSYLSGEGLEGARECLLKRYGGRLVIVTNLVNDQEK